MYYFASQSYKKYNGSKKMDGYMWSFCLFFAVICGIRYNVGADSLGYMLAFQNGGGDLEASNEYIWNYIVKFCYSCGFHFSIGNGFIAFLQIFFLYKAFKDHRYILIWLPVVLFGSRYYLDLMNGVRQMLAACGYVYLSRYIVNKKPVPFVIGIFLLSGIHHSVLILLPTYLLAYLPNKIICISEKRMVCLAIFLICFSLGLVPSFQNWISYIDSVLNLTGYENYSDLYRNALTYGNDEELSYGPTMWSFFLCSLFVIWFGPMLRKFYAEKIKYFDLWYFLSYVFSCMYFLVCNVSHMMIRPFMYVELFLATMLSLLLKMFVGRSKQYLILFFILLVVIWVCTIITVFKAYGIENESSIYKTFWGRV